MESANFWGAGPKTVVEPLWTPYLAPVPTAPAWERVPTRPTASEADILPQPPSPLSWIPPADGEEAEDVATIDEAASAQEGRHAAAMQTGQWARRNKREYKGYTAPPPAPQQDESNPDLSERQRLNLLDSYYRGTLFGAGRLALLAQLDKLSDDGISPAAKRVRDELRQEYRQIVTDLARYDRMPRFRNPSEFGAAALGQVGGGMLSPENLAGLSAKGLTWLESALKAGLQQGAISGGADPLVQGLNIGSGVQDRYDPGRTFRAAGLGALFGAGGQLGAEALGKLAARWLPGFALEEPRPVVDTRSGVPAKRPAAEVPESQPVKPTDRSVIDLGPEELPAVRQELRNQFERAMVLEPRPSDFVIIGNVSADGAARINAALNKAGHEVDVTGFQHTVTAFGSRHVLNRHGTQTRDPLPITAEDWARIPDILAAPDSITGTTTRLRLPGIIYEKRINGYIVYVEEVRTGRKTLTATTMYKRKVRDDD